MKFAGAPHDLLQPRRMGCAFSCVDLVDLVIAAGRRRADNMNLPSSPAYIQCRFKGGCGRPFFIVMGASSA